MKRVVFLDDDIRVPDPADLGKAVSLLGTHAAVGLGIGGFPDNSMVCRAFREAGGRQETFIGGSQNRRGNVRSSRWPTAGHRCPGIPGGQTTGSVGELRLGSGWSKRANFRTRSPHRRPPWCLVCPPPGSGH